MPTRSIEQAKLDGVLVDRFTRGYVTAILWASVDDAGYPLDDRFTWEHFDADTLRDIVADCAAFQRDNAVDITSDPLQAGIDYWLTRNHHGAGFWDGDWPEAGDRLTAAAHAAKERDAYVGDDGKLYLQ